MSLDRVRQWAEEFDRKHWYLNRVPLLELIVMLTCWVAWLFGALLGMLACWSLIFLLATLSQAMVVGPTKLRVPSFESNDIREDTQIQLQRLGYAVICGLLAWWVD